MVASSGVVELDCGYTEVLVAPGEMGAGGGDAGLGIAGDNGVAVDDEVSVRSNAGGVDLGAGETCQEEHQDRRSFGGTQIDGRAI